MLREFDTPAMPSRRPLPSKSFNSWNPSGAPPSPPHSECSSHGGTRITETPSFPTWSGDMPSPPTPNYVYSSNFDPFPIQSPSCLYYHPQLEYQPSSHIQPRSMPEEAVMMGPAVSTNNMYHYQLSLMPYTPLVQPLEPRWCFPLPPRPTPPCQMLESLHTNTPQAAQFYTHAQTQDFTLLHERKLIISRLPQGVSHIDLHQFLTAIIVALPVPTFGRDGLGAIEMIDIPRHPNGKMRGHAHIMMSTAQLAEDVAKRVHGCLWMGRTLGARMKKSPGDSARKTTKGRFRNRAWTIAIGTRAESLEMAMPLTKPEGFESNAQPERVEAPIVVDGSGST